MARVILLWLFVVLPVLAVEYPQADVNGYTSQNDEPIILSTDTCASGRTCHTLPSSCDVMFDKDDTATDTLAEIEALLVPTSSNRVFCFDSGDNWTTLGDTLNLPSDADCTANDPCWIINAWNVEQQNLGYPWDQSSGNQVTLDDHWDCDGANWIVAYLRWDGIAISDSVIDKTSACTDIIIANNEFANLSISGDGALQVIGIASNADGGIIQNNYAHDMTVDPGDEITFVEVTASSNETEDIIVVNNEVKDLTKGPICVMFPQTSGSDTYNCAGMIAENNDIYQTLSTDCSGTLDADGGCGYGKVGIDAKRGGSSASPYVITQNRIWHMRNSDTTVCCTGGGTPGTGIQILNASSSDIFGANYVLVQNNIVQDAQRGIEMVRDTYSISVIGNIIYNTWSQAGQEGDGLYFHPTDDSEAYLNTVIYTRDDHVDNDIFVSSTSSTGNDVRCNVFIASDATPNYTSGTNSQADYNVFYGVTTFTTGSNNIDKSAVTKWVASTNYAVGDVVFPTKMPGDAGFAEATHGVILAATADTGSSGSSEPTWPTTLGSTVVDSGITWTVIRAPYTYWRKLLSTPEQSTIPYAKALATSDLPEYNHCAGSGMGDRTGIGVDDTAPTWN